MNLRNLPLTRLNHGKGKLNRCTDDLLREANRALVIPRTWFAVWLAAALVAGLFIGLTSTP